MASTNKTSGYSLSQFIGSDIPSWLGDYNGDMLKIDTALKSINATATGANSTAISAASAAAAAQQTANSALSKANQNKQSISEISEQLTFTPKTVAKAATVTGAFACSFVRSNLIASVILSAIELNVNGGTVVGSQTFVPLGTIAGNLFSLTASNLSSASYINIAVGSTQRNVSNQILMAPSFLRAYYDGANTVFYAALDSDLYTSATQINFFANGVFLSTKPLSVYQF